MKIIFKNENVGKRHHRITGGSIITFYVNVEEKSIPNTSDFGKKLKLLIYPDVLEKGLRPITIINLSQYFVDLHDGDILGELKPLEPTINDKTGNTDKKLSD